MHCCDHGAGPDHVRRRTLRPCLLSEGSASGEERLIDPDDTPCFEIGRLVATGAVADRDRGRCYVGIVVDGRILYIYGRPLCSFRASQ